MSVTHSSFTLERHYGVTPAQTFQAFADPELKRQWFANPGRWADAVWEMDFREDGTELSSGGELEGLHREFRCHFHDIVDGERIVYAYDLLHDHRRISVSLTTVEFFAEGDGTLLRFTEQGAFFDDPRAGAVREHGTDVLLDMLGRFLAGEPVR